MKKLISLFISACVIFSTILFPTLSTNAYQIGDVLGQVVRTDITAYIDGRQIPAYACNGGMIFVAEDLRNYGFNVSYNDNARELYVTSAKVSGNGVGYIEPYTGPIGAYFTDWLFTDIVVNVNGTIVPSYAINGYSMIRLEDLAFLGDFSYDNNTRQARLVVKRSENSYVVDTNSEPTKTPILVEPSSPINTPEPTKAPEPTETPEPQKPYKVETLINDEVASTHDAGDYVDDYKVTYCGDKIYYINTSDDIIELDMKTKQHNVIMNVSDIVVEYDDNEYNVGDSRYCNILYDNSRDTLAVCCNMETENLLENKTLMNVVVSIPSSEILFKPEFKSYYYIGARKIGITSQGELIIRNHINLNASSAEPMYYLKYNDSVQLEGGTVTDFTEYNNNIYYCCWNGLYKYDYLKSEQIAKFSNKCCAVNQSGFYAFNNVYENDSVIKSDLKGNIIYEYSFDDVDIQDRTKLSSSSILSQLFVSSNDDIVFYDTAAKAFRIISEND